MDKMEAGTCYIYILDVYYIYNICTCIFPHVYGISIKNKWYPIICDNMDEPWRYAKWTKSDKERQMHDLTYK